MFDFDDFARSGTAPTTNGSSKSSGLSRSRPKTRGGSSDLADLNMSLKMDKRNQPDIVTQDDDVDNVRVAIEAWENAKKKDKPSSRQTTRKASAGATYKNESVTSAYTSQFRPIKATTASSPRNANKSTNVNSRVAEIRAIYGMSDHPPSSASSGRNSASASRKKPRAPAVAERPRSSAPDVPKSQRKTPSRKIVAKEEELSVKDIPPPPTDEPHFFEASPEIERPESRKLYLGQPASSPKATKPALKAPRSAGPVSSQQTSLKDHVDAESSGMVRTSSFAGFVRPASLWQDDIDSERPPSRQKSAFPTHLADIERAKAFAEPSKDESAAAVKVPMESLLQRPPSRQRIAAQNLFDSAEPPPTAPSTAKPKLSINTSDEAVMPTDTPIVSPLASSSSVVASPAPTSSHPPFVSSDSDVQLLAQVESMNLLPSNDTTVPITAPRPARAWLNSSSGSRKEPASQPSSTRASQQAYSSTTPSNRDRMFQAALAPRYDPHADGFADLDIQTPSTFKIEVFQRFYKASYCYQVNYSKPRSHTAKGGKGRKSPTDIPARPKSMVAGSHPHSYSQELCLVSQTALGGRRKTDDSVSDAWGIEKKRVASDSDKNIDRGEVRLHVC